jgi:hypothetical protein
MSLLLIWISAKTGLISLADFQPAIAGKHLWRKSVENITTSNDDHLIMIHLSKVLLNKNQLNSK